LRGNREKAAKERAETQRIRFARMRVPLACGAGPRRGPLPVYKQANQQFRSLRFPKT
jgi:hypothetical protein